MPHEIDQYPLSFFDDWENDAIESWLNKRGLEWDFPTVCGSCCGFYEQEFWIKLTSNEVTAFNAFARGKGIEAQAHPNGIRIGSPT